MASWPWQSFPRYGTFVRGNHRSAVYSSHKGPGMLSFDMLLAWKNYSTNSRVAGDLRCDAAHVTSLWCSVRNWCNPIRAGCVSSNLTKYWLKLVLEGFISNNDVIMNAMAPQITSMSIVCSAVCWGAHQRKRTSCALLSSVRENHRWSVGSLHKGSVIQMIFPFDDVIMSHFDNALVSFNTSATGI